MSTVNTQSYISHRFTLSYITYLALDSPEPNSKVPSPCPHTLIDFIFPYITAKHCFTPELAAAHFKPKEIYTRFKFQC